VLRKPPPKAPGEAYARAGSRLQQEEIGLHAVRPLRGTDGGVAEALAEELEQRPGRGIRIDDENGRHRRTVRSARGNGGWAWYETGMSAAASGAKGAGANETRVLVVDDDDDIRNLVRTLVERTGAVVRDAANGRDGLREFHGWRPDLVVLDVNMPEMDGWSVLERIRDMSDVPVLMLTARGDELERVRGLQAGADDYVVKPFGRQELVARIQALLRRASRAAVESESETYADAYVTIDWGQARVTVGDREVQLTPLEFRLLSTFVRHPRQVLSRDQLLELVWGDTFGVGGDQVKLYVGYLRRKLEPEQPDSVPIETVRGFGYRYKAP
jgi:DNA-binding response OmpR family regulator